MKQKPTSLQLVEDLKEEEQSRTISRDIVFGLHYEYLTLQKKYEKVLSIMSSFYPPCELDGFMDKNAEYCFMNCGLDDEIFKKCWDRYIEESLEEE